MLHETLSQKKMIEELGMVTHTCNPRDPREAVGGLCKSDTSLSHRVRFCLQKIKELMGRDSMPGVQGCTSGSQDF